MGLNVKSGFLVDGLYSAGDDVRGENSAEIRYNVELCIETIGVAILSLNRRFFAQSTLLHFQLPINQQSLPRRFAAGILLLVLCKPNISYSLNTSLCKLSMVIQ